MQRIFSAAQAHVLRGTVGKKNIFKMHLSAVSGRRLRHKPHLYPLGHGQTKQPHHIKHLSVQRIMHGKGVPFARVLQGNGRLGCDALPDCIIGKPVCNHAYRRMGAEIGLLKTGLGPKGGRVHCHVHASPAAVKSCQTVARRVKSPVISV